MLKKSYSKTKRSCRVTFDLPQETKAENVALCGEFNNWNPSANPMKLRRDGRFSTTISLPRAAATVLNIWWTTGAGKTIGRPTVMSPISSAPMIH